LELLDGYEVLLLSESAEDLNLSFVVRHGDADSLVTKMHAALFPPPREGTHGKVQTHHPHHNDDEMDADQTALLGSSWTVLSSALPRLE
jgi:hypothetical protein